MHSLVTVWLAWLSDHFKLQLYFLSSFLNQDIVVTDCQKVHFILVLMKDIKLAHKEITPLFIVSEVKLSIAWQTNFRIALITSLNPEIWPLQEHKGKSTYPLLFLYQVLFGRRYVPTLITLHNISTGQIVTGMSNTVA